MKTFKILSLDGGGIRGAFGAAFIAELETIHQGGDFADYFDLIAGTSTGGILATALGFRKPTAAVSELYEEFGPKIFSERRLCKHSFFHQIAVKATELALRTCGLPLNVRTLFEPRYGSDALRGALQNVFSDEEFGKSKSRLVIPSVDVRLGQTKVFKTPHLPDHHYDRRLLTVDVVLSTTAAPTYFPHCDIDVASKFVDGGLWANNPGMIGYVEALRILKLQQQAESVDVIVLSVGTGKPRYSLNPPGNSAGIAWWGLRGVDLILTSQSQGTHFQLTHVLGTERYLRVDFDFPGEEWKLDAIEYLPQLVQLGKISAHTHYQEIAKKFLTKRSDPFTVAV